MIPYFALRRKRPHDKSAATARRNDEYDENLLLVVLARDSMFDDHDFPGSGTDSVRTVIHHGPPPNY
jgi:hypothetical protein